MNRVKLVVALLTLLLDAGMLNAQDKKPKIEVKPIARMQMQFVTSSVNEEEILAARRTPATPPSSTFEMRRIRFGTIVTLDEWIETQLEMEFAHGRLATRSTFVNFEVDPAFQVQLGQFKKPFSMMELYSENIWPVIERGVRIRGLADALTVQDSLAGTPRLLTNFRGTQIPADQYEILSALGYLSYELGAMVHGEMGQFGYAVGVFNGELSDRTDTNDDKSFAGRLTFKPGSKLPIVVGAGVSRRETRTTTRPTITTAEGTAYEVDLEIGAFRRAGLRFMGEVSLGDNLAVDDDFFGAQGMLSWFKPVSGKRVEGVELAARAGYGDPRKDIEDDEAILFTPGFNVYFSGRNRLMINWDVYSPVGERFETQNALRLQAQLYY